MSQDNVCKVCRDEFASSLGLQEHECRGAQAPGSNFLCHRIIISKEGEAVSTPKFMEDPDLRQYFPEVMFKRKDGWSLGACAEFESVAYNMWPDEWTHFVRAPSMDWLPIGEYK